MKIEVQTPRIQHPQYSDVYKIVLSCYRGDADGDGSMTLYVRPDDLKKVIAELELVKNQFHGRGGCRDMFNQCLYFCDDADENFFVWLSQEEGYPFDHDVEQNYTLQGYTVTYFDKYSEEYRVKIGGLQELISDITALNKEQHIGKFDIWGGYCRDQQHLYEAYRLAAIELVKKHS